ncbi:MAG: corrinoid protein [Chloroflexi bacterium]|nr:corrinoid protein [Chloroflexota bacterium]
MIIEGDHKGAERWARDALNQGVNPKEIIDRGLIPGMDEVGRRFKSNEYHMPEVLISARAMKTAMALVRPLISGDAAGSRGRVVIGTVRGDLHDIGKNLVSMMLEGAGYEVYDLGVDVAPQNFVKAVEDRNADLIGLSALLTTSMPMMKQTVDALRQAELTNKGRIMVGGAPVNQTFADQIGAHGYAPDGATAVDVANRLMGVRAA